jgi:hypothetical protein
MLVQNKIIDSAKVIISGSLASNNKTNWHLYGMFDQVDQTGIQYPCIKVLCMEESPEYPANKLGLHKANLQIQTFAVRVVGTNAGEGTTATEFETVSDYVFNPFLSDNVESVMTSNGNNIQFKQVIEDGLEVTPLTDGFYANQKLICVVTRTA